ncbi:putative membrane protein [Propionispora sp. 2/2-37]|uniref:transglycosylase domain-containing protein n=1 Tax=Propionispora sp. 2/2-37 TaxID=1677858 RepID=UPI0006BB7366|nr:PBP1A family penicillin-binding protein [Propionispora sp. 2/2-37]CUH94240.1 putative membrane protein [Propionispora sp. 2/2-37]
MKKHPNLTCICVLLLFLMLCLNGCSFFRLPQTDNLENLQLIEATQVFDENGQLIAKLFEENRVVVPLNSMSVYVQQAIIANEDIRFYSHFGIDPIGILRAAWANIRAGGLVEGGSTLTQQLAKNMYLTQERTFTRKLNELFLAITLERKFTKQEILQAYLNQVYFGEGAYGVEAAAQVYFGKHASELSLAESALLAGLPRGPNIYSPYVDPNAAAERRSIVLDGMVNAGYITPEAAATARQEKIVLAGKKKRSIQASYFIDYIANQLVERYGANRVYRGGLKIYTTLDSKVQQLAEAALGNYQGAVVALDPRTGYIKAMVGGKNYEESQLNRVVAEIRQPGSAFKPFVYTTALNQGLSVNSLLVDEPLNINGYKPKNYDKKYNGAMTLKKALSLSVNTAAVKLGQQVGMSEVLTLAKNLGLSTIVPEDDNLAAALGGLTQGVSLLELSTAYTPFANNGILSKPVSIIKVLDENNQVLEENHLVQQAVLRPEIAYLATDMMKAVITRGTGTAANIGRESAGKTGTTDNYETAWFIGFTPEILVGILVGNDDRKPVDISGSQVAQLWGTMVSQIPVVSQGNFVIPPNMVTGVPVCSTSGKLATPDCPEIEYDAFIKGTEPTEFDFHHRTGNKNPQASQKESDKKDAAKEEKKKPRWRLPFKLPKF